MSNTNPPCPQQKSPNSPPNLCLLKVTPLTPRVPPGNVSPLTALVSCTQRMSLSLESVICFLSTLLPPVSVTFSSRGQNIQHISLKGRRFIRLLVSVHCLLVPRQKQLCGRVWQRKVLNPWWAGSREREALRTRMHPPKPWPAPMTTSHSTVSS